MFPKYGECIHFAKIGRKYKFRPRVNESETCSEIGGICIIGFGDGRFCGAAIYLCVPVSHVYFFVGRGSQSL